MLKVVYSNDMLQLAAHLAETQKNQPLPPLYSEQIIVQSNELARWLSLFLAQQQGISANNEFPFPSAAIWAIFRKILPDIPRQSPYSTDAMSWRLLVLLEQYRQQPGYEPIDAYLGPQPDQIKLYSLARRIADSFDQYLVYRPDWIRDWEAGETPHWQARLWQKLTSADQQPMHQARLLMLMEQALKQTTAPAGLPARLTIFGLSALPPIYLNLFALLAQHCELTLYFQSPSAEYWGDLQDQKTQHKQHLLFDEAVNHAESGHPLLASLGKQGQAFFEQIQHIPHDVDSCYVPPEGSRLLTRLQRDIFLLQDPLKLETKTLITEDDDSLRIHACHSPMREIEVLHDQLLNLFETHTELSATDVVVMTANIDQYAPWIDAVFGTAPTEQFIPYSIADCASYSQTQLIDSFKQLLQLPQSRFDVESILSLLESRPIQRRFQLNDEALIWVRRWIKETRTRWAYSAEDKAALDLPASAANTWRAGLDRLLLGYAMPMSEPGQHWRLFDGHLAVDGISGERAKIMAQLCAFVETLDRWRQRLQQPRSANDWQQTLNQCLDDFFELSLDDEGDEAAELMSLRKALDGLVDTSTLADFADQITIELVAAWLADHVEPSSSEHRYMGHGLTFCGMVPMRSIPFAVVCLIGMNDGSYPRQQPRQGFDLLANDFRRGDRSRRDDDRYLFLQSLLSAGSHAYISYVGASIRDNAPIPPSVLVSDLRDVLRQGYAAAGGGDIWQQLLTSHPLQAFSRRYFDGVDPRLFSYQKTSCPQQQRQVADRWFDTALSPADSSWRQLSLQQLIQFYHHPGRFLLRERLQIQLENSEEALETREPFSLDGLEAWQLRQTLLEGRLQSQSVAELQQFTEAGGSLPQGHIGAQIFEQQLQKVDSFIDTLKPLNPKQSRPAHTFNLTIAGFQLSGTLDGLTSEGLFQYRLTKSSGRDLLSLWLSHLLLNILDIKGVTKHSQLLTEDEYYQLEPVKDAEPLLNELLSIYWQGLQAPLPFFSKSSYAFARAYFNDGEAAASRAGLSAWQGNMQVSGEQDDPYLRQLYQAAPLDESFRDLALKIYTPLQTDLAGGKL